MSPRGNAASFTPALTPGHSHLRAAKEGITLSVMPSFFGAFLYSHTTVAK